MAGRRQVACVQQHGPANAKVAASDVARGGIEPPTRGFSESTTCSVCQPRPQAHQGTITAHPV